MNRQEAIQIVKNNWPNDRLMLSEALKFLIPELQESRDEKIRNVIRGWIYTQSSSFFDNGISKEEMLAWLEKQEESKEDTTRYKIAQYLKNLILDQSQRGAHMLDYEGRIEEEVDFIISIAKKELKNENQGEQKPADKVDLKFHVGDWVIGRVTENEPRQISEITEEGYRTTYGGWIGFSFGEDMHFWTVQDAKDGDVLVTKGRPFLFKGFTDKWHPKHPVAYCGIDTLNIFIPSFENCNWTRNPCLPATKEQCDLLFQKMHEAGYEWDAEKKELKEIEQKLTWSEEDEDMFDNILQTERDCISYCNVDGIGTKARFCYEEEIEWLKSIKQRISFHD